MRAIIDLVRETPEWSFDGTCLLREFVLPSCEFTPLRFLLKEVLFVHELLITPLPSHVQTIFIIPVNVDVCKEKLSTPAF